MVDDYHIKVDVAGRVFVLLHPGCRIDRKAILALLKEAGIDESVVTFLPPEEVDECGDIDDALVLIPIDAAVCDSPELDDAGRRCGQAGARVIILFGDSLPYEDLHPIADKYGTQCGWSADQLKPYLAGSGLLDPRSGTGAPVIRPRARQVKC